MRKIIAIITAVFVILSLSVSAFAATYETAGIQSSAYLSSYGVLLSQSTNHRLAITVDVEGTHLMSRIGIYEIDIEELNSTTGNWEEYDTWYGSSNMSTFYDYDSYDYLNLFYFTGTPGNQYRVIVTVLAMDANGFDTGSVISVTRTCP